MKVAPVAPAAGQMLLRHVAARLRVDTALLIELHGRGDFPPIGRNRAGHWIVRSEDAVHWFQARAVEQGNRPDLEQRGRSTFSRPMTP